jgi:hypothetical protein
MPHDSAVPQKSLVASASYRCCVLSQLDAPASKNAVHGNLDLNKLW